MLAKDYFQRDLLQIVYAEAKFYTPRIQVLNKIRTMDWTS